MLDVPEWLRAFDPAWFEVAATGPDGFEEAMAAAMQWRQARRYFTADHPIPGSAVDWLQASFRVRRDVWRASLVWRARAES